MVECHKPTSLTLSDSITQFIGIDWCVRTVFVCSRTFWHLKCASRLSFLRTINWSAALMRRSSTCSNIQSIQQTQLFPKTHGVMAWLQCVTTSFCWFAQPADKRQTPGKKIIMTTEFTEDR